MDPQQNGTGVPQQQAGGQNGNVPNMAPNQRVQQPGPNQQGGPAQNGQQRQAQQSQQQLMQQINLEQFQRMMPAEVQRAPQSEQLAYIRKLITTQKARSGNAANAAAGAGVQGQQTLNTNTGTQGSPQAPQQAGANMQTAPVNMQANGRPPQNHQQVTPEAMQRLLATARQNPTTMNSLTQMMGQAQFPAGATPQQREALARFAQQNRGGQQTQGGAAAAAQLVAQTQRMMQAQQQQALGNGGSPVQAQPNQNGNLPGPRPNQQGVQSQPLQVQAQTQNDNPNQGVVQSNGSILGGRAPPPGPISMPSQAGQARPPVPAAGGMNTAQNPNNAQQRPNLNKQALDQQLANILSNLDVFIQKKENNQLGPEETKMLNQVIALRGPTLISQQQQQLQQQQQQQQQQQAQVTPQQQQHIQQNLARQFQQARANSQNGNIPPGGVHTGAHLAAYRQLQSAQAAAQGQAGNMVLSPQNIGMMNMNQAAIAANMGQGPSSQNGGTSTPGQQARIQQALAMQAGNAQAGAGMSMGLSPHNMDSPNSVSGSNVMGVPAANMAYERIDNLGEEKRTLVFDKNPSIRKSYMRYLSQQSQEKRAALFAEHVALGAMYEQHLMDEQNAQNQLSQGPLQGQDGNAQAMSGGQPGGQMNLQLPAGRQRPQAQGNNGGAPGPGRAGPQAQAPAGMNLQPNAALQAQMNAAQQQALAAQIQAQNQLAQQQREVAAASSPASMHGTPVLHNDSGLPVARGGTPARVGSLQGGRGVRASPNVANATAVSMPNQANNPMNQQQRMQAQAQLQLAQVANNARAQLQANYHSQAQNLNANQAGLAPHMHGPPGGIPPGVPANLMPGVPHPGQIPPNIANFIAQPVIHITPTDIRSLIIPDILTETANSAPKPAKFLDYVRPSRLSLSNGLGANHSMAMPVYSARPPALEQLSTLLKGKNGRTAALKGTLFDKAFSAEPEEEKEEPKVDDRPAIEVVEEENEHRSEVGKRSPGQMSVDEVEEETTIHPRVKRRKLCDVAKLAKRDLTISEGSEEFLLQLCDEFIESALETSCRLAKHRKSNKLEIKDMQFLLAHNYDVQLPGYASDAIRIEQNKADLRAIASSIPSSRASRLNAVQQAKSGAKVKG